jgi:SAM-dependent methyltransferase
MFTDACRTHGVHRIVELGTGSGQVARVLLDQGFALHCVDASAEPLDHFVGTLPLALRRRTTTAATAFEHLALESGTAEALVAIRSVNHGGARDMRRLLRQMIDWLRPNGLLLLYVTADRDFRAALGRQLDRWTTIPEAGPERGIPHVFLTEYELAGWLYGLEIVRHRLHEFRVPRETPYFDAYPEASLARMRDDALLSRHHVVIAQKSELDTGGAPP